jgi:hypothetical protein
MGLAEDPGGAHGDRLGENEIAMDQADLRSAPAEPGQEALNGCRQEASASSMPRSTSSWQSMQKRVQGTASSRLGLIGPAQLPHRP